jgi:hypothetical protein
MKNRDLYPFLDLKTLRLIGNIANCRLRLLDLWRLIETYSKTRDLRFMTYTPLKGISYKSQSGCNL